ncbi:BrnA antitoxin family protein [Providencia stuartii]|uniref:BrnA antitoxin family protein n=2 Tax=Providencia stuartii TaxID=588 RepID=A0AAI9GFW0_PROST|nr:MULTISPECIES: BrnA antitoxin family protein [Providencia]EDU61054.1 toxin-antitoxin system, antitoxin component, ribbon-helix-helix domain protein [Providencia stuartii ATCC 25827]ELR5112918.1 BrnA antitoxin family protein [Providencia stuartii]MBQ0457417.1 BrnA antitoxin family protein [Providencia stuartii]MBS7785403.1 BrnA antitoxin family protein [Providencia thailandensis]MTC81659.1 cytoplasmic protein [Providencia stuartii]
MSKTIIKRGELPPLTDTQKSRLKQISEMDDSRVNTSDIPELPIELWLQGQRGKFYKPVKTATTVRIDNDVIDWLKSQGKGYQTRMNAILRDAMLKDKKGHS